MSKYIRKTGMIAFTRKEFDAVIDHAETAEKKMLFLITGAYGFRREDAVILRSSWIHLEDPANMYLEFWEEKKDQARRIPVGVKIAGELKRYLATMPKSRWLFPAKNTAKHITGRTAWNWLNETCDRAGIPRRPFHALRGFCVKEKQRTGWTVEMTAAILGDRVATVIDHYATPTEEELRAKMMENEGI
jgi:integrase